MAAEEKEWDEDVAEDDITPPDEWNLFKDRLISIAGDKSIGDGFLRLDQGTLSDRPSAAMDGRLYYATDEGKWYRDNGDNWIELVRAEGETRLGELSEKDYGSLDGIPDEFDPKEHGDEAHELDYVTDAVGDIETTGLEMEANIKPDADSSRKLGLTDRKFSEVHAVNIYGTVHYDDLAFTEKRCEVCREKFEEGDDISLIVNEVKEDGTYLVPKHERC